MRVGAIEADILLNTGQALAAEKDVGSGAEKMAAKIIAAEKSAGEAAKKMAAEMVGANAGAVAKIEGIWAKAKMSIGAGNIGMLKNPRGDWLGNGLWQGITDAPGGGAGRMGFDPGGEISRSQMDARAAFRAMIDGGGSEAAIEADATMSRAGVSGGKGFFAGLNSELGKKSLFGQVMKLAAGGGAIAAVGMATREIGAMGDEIGGLTTKLRMGEITEREAMDQFAFGIPIIGNLARGFAGLAEALTGEGAAAKKAAEAEKLHNQEMREAAKLAREQNAAADKAAVSFNRQAGDLHNKNELAAMDPGLERTALDRKNEDDLKIRALRDQEDEAMKAAGVTKNELDQLRLKMQADTPGSLRWKNDSANYKDAMERSSDIAIPVGKAIAEILQAQAHDIGRMYVAAYGAGPAFLQDKVHETPTETFAKDLEKIPALEKPAFTRERLPNPVLKAEELLGPKTVTEGLPQYIDVQKENTEVTRGNTEAMKEAAAAVTKLTAGLQSGPTAGGASLDSLAGG